MRQSNIDKYKLDSVDIKIARRIRERRQELRMSQQQVAEYLGVSRPNVTHYESGRQKLNHRMIKRLSEVLKKPVAYFLEDDDVYQENQFVNNEDVKRIMSEWKIRKFLEGKKVSQGFINDMKQTTEYLCELHGEKFEDIWE